MPEMASQEVHAPMVAAAATIERLPLLNLIGRSYFGADCSVGDDLADEDLAVEAFHRHAAAVQESLPAERLLVFDVRQDWEPFVPSSACRRRQTSRFLISTMPSGCGRRSSRCGRRARCLRRSTPIGEMAAAGVPAVSTSRADPEHRDHRGDG